MGGGVVLLPAAAGVTLVTRVTQSAHPLALRYHSLLWLGTWRHGKASHPPLLGDAEGGGGVLLPAAAGVTLVTRVTQLTQGNAWVLEGPSSTGNAWRSLATPADKVGAQ